MQTVYRSKNSDMEQIFLDSGRVSSNSERKQNEAYIDQLRKNRVDLQK